IRGFRIELGEVGAALADVTGVEQAIAIVREDQPGSKRLVGYVTGAVDPTIVRAAVGSRLPEYMIPSAVVVLDSLPLTVNGKLDKRALPTPDYTDNNRYRAPSTPTEKTLASIYAQVLGLEHVGIDDSFFNIGGDSISSIQVVARARAAGITVKPREIMVHKTVSALAHIATQTTNEMNDDDGVGDLPPTPIITWLQNTPGRIDEFNQALLFTGPETAEHTHVLALIQALLDTHPILRLHVNGHHRTDRDWTLTTTPPGSIHAQDCIDTVTEISLDNLITAREKLDITTGSVLRALWEPTNHQLALIIHHLAIDVVSWRIINDDLNLAWNTLHTNQQITLPTGGTSFRTWSMELINSAQTDEVSAQLPTWHKIASTPPILPTIEPGIDIVGTAEHHVATLGLDTTDMLLGNTAARLNMGVNEILLTALALALAEHTRHHSPIGIDVESHGRDERYGNDADLSRTIGWFTAKYPISL
ncbi:condensation domain-containing protein, partial [Nocardia sp. NPDC059195]|uniref:condensation domain-containing protein n=1 Tax=Nocardia sp. NPDC059195 TaxID=3346765 RepID=UPI0036A6B14F